MKRFATLSLSLGMIATTIIPPSQVAMAASSVWKPFTSKDGRFTVLMPGQPTIIEETVRNTAVRKFVAEDNTQGTIYMVIYGPRGTRTADLQSIVQNGKLLSKRSISIQQQPGQESIYESAKEIIKHRVFIAGNRAYQIVAAIDKQKYKDLSGSTEGFLNSFKVDLKTKNTKTNR
jgi:hypothetical protein